MQAIKHIKTITKPQTKTEQAEQVLENHKEHTTCKNPFKHIKKHKK